ncbi:MAG: SDR family NAD(P)-dependent oxidoreductase [Saprospiraceae bacterium]|nr:SDR family NAD(P)-dependent oxidoreductase [Saprospiraceae bacterium]
MNAIVTGSTKGIGKAIVELLVSKGINVAICSRNENEINSFLKAIDASSHNVKAIGKKTDMSIKSEVLEFADFVLKEFETIDILVNNAGIFLPGELTKEEDGALEKMIETNLYSAYHLTRAIVPNMIANKSGHIFNMCSIASQIAYPNGGSYSISKFALLGFSKVLREELKSMSIKVTSILPGATWSASWEGVDLPKTRLMQAEDIAKIVWSALEMSPSAVIEDIVIRPQLGDL